MTTKTLIPTASILLFFGSVALIVLYVTFLNQTIIKGVSSHSLERKVLDANALVSEREFEYIALKNQINIEFAREFGFEEIKNAKYVTRSGLAHTLSSNTIR